ncbi:MAG: hypothetical protein Kow00120_04550 [Anaerolineae bacterium]
MRRLRFPLLEAIAIAVGLTTLIGLVVGGTTGAIASVFIQIAAVTAGVALLIGVVNLAVVHLSRVARTSTGWVYSLVLLIAMLAVIVGRVIELAQNDPDPALGSGPVTGPLFDVLQFSIEAALAGLVAFFLVYAAFRMMRRRVTPSAALFVAVVVVLLLAWGTLPVIGNLLAGVRDWIVNVPATGGARGILIGVALGTVVVGIRVLIGRDRPYKG